MPAPILSLVDAVVWINGAPFDGHAEEIGIEAIEFGKSEEESRLGLMGTPKVMTKFEPIILTVNFRSPMADWSVFTADPFTAVNMQFLGNISADETLGRTDDLPWIIEATAIPDQHDIGTIEGGEIPTFETSFNCTQLSQTINGELVLDFDLYAYTYLVNGVDLMEARRANLGL